MVYQEKVRITSSGQKRVKAIVTAMAFSFLRMRLLAAVFLLMSVWGCNQSEMLADLVYEFENGDREFPEGLYLEFYDESGKLESTLRANEAYYFKKENQWRGRGKVEVKNLEKNEQLNTEELFWKPADEKIFTDKFVTIRQQSDVIYGQGLEAKQDMSDYVIKKPEGEFSVDD